ncbi:hypothetical protein R1sor_026508 [Riccia sorocarpa]|uniref:DUF7869 domain-containing protein n=1 Tax=Riccia sorocarpa TaxID=122646 RepID=A0ABD3GBL9_9MARC
MQEKARSNDAPETVFCTPVGATQEALAPVISSLLGVTYSKVKVERGRLGGSSMNLMDASLLESRAVHGKSKGIFQEEKTIPSIECPPRVLFSQFPSLAPLGNDEIEEHEENAQDENEDDGPFASEALSDSEEENNPEQVPVTGRRFKETLRERNHQGSKLVIAGNDDQTKWTQAFILLEWLDSFFLSHCERQPADGKYHIPNNFTKKEVYDHYKTDMVQVRECLQYSSFKHYWVKFYQLVTIPTTNKFSVCDFCELYKSKRDKGVTNIEKAEAVEALKLHRKQHAEERAAAGRRRWKALDSPKDCPYIQIDGMDQKKTALPHFSKQPKSIDGAALVGVHLVGAMIFHGKLRTRAFLTYNNLKSDSNLTITVLQKILLEWDGILPPTLYLQLDNNVRENKNNILFAYLAMLLEKKVFTKIKLGFLLVGHTHDFVDQMFSRFSQALRRENAFTMSRLRSVIESSYNPKPVTTILTQTWDFKHFIETEPKLFRTLNDITQNQQYKFKIASALEVRVWCKQFSTDNTWEPPAGIRNIMHIDASRAILASEQVPLKSYAEIKRQTRRVQNIGPVVERQEGEVVRHVKAIRQDIQTHCYPFFDDEQKDWWNHWFMLQEEIGRNISNNRRERLVGDMCWFWPVPPERDEHAVDELVAMTTTEEFRRRIFGQRRPIYSGPRRPPPDSAAADRAAHIGELTEIHDKSFLAVLADDETSFWICQVLKINRRNEEGEPTSVLIQWYATEDSNPYTGKFYPEKRRTNGKGRAALFRQEIDLEEVTVLSFNFNFTTARRLRKITERQIRTGLFRIAKDKEASQPEGINRLSPTIDSADDEETECSGPDLEDEEE